jgi:hypothetical protein
MIVRNNHKVIGFLLLSFLAATFNVDDAAAQSAGLSAGSASGMAGASVTLPVTFTSGATPVSMLQLDIMFPSSLSYMATSTGTVATAAGKSAVANPISGGVRIVISGINTNGISSGVLADVQLAVSAGTPGGSIPVAFRSGSITASDPTGFISVPVSDTAGSVTVPASGDTTAPSISGVSSSGISNAGATITWTTDEASNTQVDYGTTTGYGNSTTLNTSMVTSHSQLLGELSASTLYHYRVKSMDAAGNLASSGDYTFTTTATSIGDITAPAISGVLSSKTSDNSASINWTTDEASDSQIDYGTTTSYGSSSSLNSAMVTSHLQALAGLSANTLYHYRVKSKDAAGNLSVSGDYTFTTLSAADTTAPTISDVSSSNITGIGAIIAWTTDEAADSEVEYGTTAEYGGGTPINSTTTTLHTQAVTGLMSNTLYHYRVKSKDAAGNLSVSGDFTFTTSNAGSPPVISGITVSNVTNKSATISWVTDKLSNSEVEYRFTGSALSKAVLGTLTTTHSLILNDLKRQTTYYFWAKSADAEGNQAVTPELTFTTTLYGALALALPRFSAGQNVLGADTMMGMGLANLDPVIATLKFTAVDDDGDLTVGEEITNPMVRDLNPGMQLPIVDWQIFGSGLSNSNSSGYVKLESTSANTNGFFLIFDSNRNLMDGANLSDAQMTDFAFTEIQTDGYNKISIINDNPHDTELTFDLVKSDGSSRSSQSRVIKSNGALEAEIFSDLFADVAPDATDYVRVRSSEGVQSFHVMRQKSGDIATLEGQDITTGATTLYSPQYVVGGPYRTSLSIINLDSRAGTVTLRFVREDGVQMGAARTVAIPANGKIFIDDPGFFQSLDPNVETAGYVEMVSNGVRLMGSTVFGDRNRQSFSSALALISKLQTSVLFSHVASNDLFFTGLAILNPNETDTTVTIELYTEEGLLTQRRSVTIGAGKRQARLLTQYFTMLQGQNRTSGYIRLTSLAPIASFALFGTGDLSVLSAIPPLILQ